jgi:hypothetical protein
MANDESQQQDDEISRSDESRHESSDPIILTTTDPVIESVAEQQLNPRSQPDTNLRVETTQVSEPSPLFVAGVRRVNDEDPPHQESGHSDGGHGRNGGGQQGRRQGKDRNEADSKNRDNRQDRSQQQRQPSTWKSLLASAGVALICGVIGAAGYWYFFGSKSDQSSDQSQGESGSGSKSSSGSKKSSGGDEGGSKKQAGKGSDPKAKPSSNSESLNTNSQSGSSGSEDIVKQQIMDLLERVDRLNERIDHVNQPRDQTSPMMQAFQIELGKLTQQMNDLATLPGRFQQVDKRFDTLQEQFKVLRARIEVMQRGSIDGRPSPGVPRSPGAAAPGPDAGASALDKAAMDQGIALLESGQFAPARDVFLRLQVAQPDDARVWYYSAIAEGLTTGDWDGKAMRFAERGIECERAGHPSVARIDAALATGSPIKGQDWVALLRQRARSPGSAPR